MDAVTASGGFGDPMQPDWVLGASRGLDSLSWKSPNLANLEDLLSSPMPSSTKPAVY